MASSKGSRRYPTPRPRDGAEPAVRAESLGAQAASAAKAAAAFYRGWKANRSAVNPIDVERQRQAERYQAAMTRYRSQVSGLRARLVLGTGAAVGGAAVAASTIGPPSGDAAFVVLGGSAAALGAWQALRGHVGMKHLDEPPPPPAIVAAPLALPQGSPGADAASRVTSVRMHIMALLPTIEQLHAEAADQIRSVDAATAPALNALVERIRSMQHIIAQMPGTPAAQSASITINALVIRLNDGAAAYQELLESVIGLSSAPGLEGPARAQLRPAIEDMRAYAAGLERAAQTWR